MHQGLVYHYSNCRNINPVLLYLNFINRISLINYLNLHLSNTWLATEELDLLTHQKLIRAPLVLFWKGKYCSCFSLKCSYLWFLVFRFIIVIPVKVLSILVMKCISISKFHIRSGLRVSKCTWITNLVF